MYRLFLPLVWLWEATAAVRDRLDLACVSARIAQVERRLDDLPRGRERDVMIQLRLCLYRKRLAIRSGLDVAGGRKWPVSAEKV